MFDSWNVSLGNERVCMALTMHKIEHNIKKVNQMIGGMI